MVRVGHLSIAACPPRNYRCRGSMAMVHASCLNSWRNASVNTRSFFQCDQCGYKYNTERTEYAKWLEAPELSTSVSVACIVLLTTTVGERRASQCILCSSLLHSEGLISGASRPGALYPMSSLWSQFGSACARGIGSLGLVSPGVILPQGFGQL